MTAAPATGMGALAPRILITGFGPFPGVEENRSARLVRALTGGRAARLGGAHVRAVVLPVAWAIAPRRAIREALSFRPHAILHFGVSSRADSFRLETRASNAREGLPDCLGCMPGAAADRPRTKPATFDIRPAVSALRRAGIAAEPSDCAGAYLCNQVFYESLTAQEFGGGALVGFVHIPHNGTARPLRQVEPASAALLIKGARILIAEAARQVRLALRLQRVEA